MKNIAKFSVNKAITVFMAVILVAVFGIVSFTRLSTDLFPSINIPYTVVVTPYMGASPSEVEEIVSRPLEETFATTTNVKEITSTSQENMSIIMMEFESDTNMDSAVIEMRENLDMVASSLPDDVGDSMIIKLNPDMMPIMSVSISKEGFTQQELSLFVKEEVLPQVERLGGVASVSTSGMYQSEIHVVLDETAIADLNSDISDMLLLTDPLDEVEDFQVDKEMISQILQAQNFEFPVGYIDVEGVNYLVRVGDEIEDVNELRNLTLFDASPMIPAITLDDLADIDVVNANQKEYSKVNGENAITLTIQKGSSAVTTEVTDEVLRVLNDIEDSEDMNYTVLLNQGEYINESTGTVVNNLLIGAVLAVIVLFVFLRNVRATFVVGVAIPISLLFAIILIYLSGITLNIVSLGGLALGIGMLVDNSIVVMENIFRFKQEGYSNKEAAIKGASQVGGAITASTLTTISVFLPIIFIEGFIKEIFIQMALTIAFSLLASLMIALTLVPSIASKIFNDNVQQKRNKDLSKTYKKVLQKAFQFKWIILPIVVVLFIASIFLALRNGFEYFPASDEGQLSISVNNPVNEPLEYDEFITTLDELNDDLIAMDDVETVGITLGGGQMMFLGVTDTNSATVNVILAGNRKQSTLDMEATIKSLLAEDYTNIEFEVSGSQQMTETITGSGIQVQIQGYDLDTLKETAMDLATLFEDVDGLVDIDNGIGREAEEIKITVNKDLAAQYGITTGQVLGAIADKISQEEVVTELSTNGHLYEVYVYDSSSNTDETTYTLSEIEAMVVGVNQFNPNDPILVGEIATVEQVKGFSSITRSNGSRVLSVTGSFAPGYTSNVVAEDVQDVVDNYELPEGYHIEVLGENEEIMEAFEVLGLAVLLGIVLIYMIMASQFQSLTYPFIIMFTIPLAFTGGFLILFFANMSVSVVALIGLIVLTGVVVNNGIVLVDYTNQLRDEGYELHEALEIAGATRLRPIVMTALTTILALITMAIGFGDGAEMMQPMALTTIGGLLYATGLTLIVVPIMYSVVSKYGQLFLSMMSAFVILLAVALGYLLMPSIWIGIIGAVLLVIIVILNILFWRKEAASHE